MPDETTAALQEIAGLLRRRVEQFEESSKRSEERMAKIDAQKSLMPDTDKMRAESEQRMSKYTEKAEQRRQEEEQQRERLQEEDRQFKQRLITELERHNLLLERLLSRMA